MEHNPHAIGLAASQLARAFPFHLDCDGSLRIVSSGPQLKNIVPGLNMGDPVGLHFDFERPLSATPTPEWLESISGTMCILKRRAGTLPLRLRGQWMADKGRFLFIGGPWLTDVTELLSLGLSISAFPPHDPLVDLLVLMRGTKTAQEDAERIATKLREDIVARRKAEEEVRRLNADLVDRIEALQRATSRQTVAQQVTQILAEAGSMSDAVPPMIRAMGNGLDFHFGAYFTFERRSQSLRMAMNWSADPATSAPFVSKSRQVQFERGVGLPGRVWDSRTTIWVENLDTLGQYPRREAALQCGFGSGIGIPVVVSGEFHGILELFGTGPRPIDHDIVALFDSIGSQFGQFIERKEAEVERALAEAEAHRLAHNDPLTGLHNRLYLTEALEEAVASAKSRGSNLALMFLDLDRFKLINDTLGHGVGDQLLCEVANRLRKSVRDSDIVARVGGDEFVVVLPNVSDSAIIRRIAASLVQTLSQPYEIAPHTLRTRPSVGVSMFPFDGEDPTTLLRNADLAMYHAKETAHDPVHFFSEKMLGRSQERLALDDGLHRAMERGEFEVLYQPQSDLVTGHIVGAEALIRWNHPVDGLVLPDTFIPVAEENGLIYPIGQWLIGEVCGQISAWRSEGLPSIPVAINLSPKQFRQDSLAEIVSGIAANANIDPSLLEIELTESTVMRKAELAADVLGTLNARGFRIAIDDFGTGYSSLAYLRQFPVHKVKIDRSFVLDLPGDENAAAIAIAIIRMAKSLGLQVVAEGVETEAQRAFLAEQGTDIMQGFLFSKPVDAATFAKQLREGGSTLLFAPGTSRTAPIA